MSKLSLSTNAFMALILVGAAGGADAELDDTEAGDSELGDTRLTATEVEYADDTATAVPDDAVAIAARQSGDLGGPVDATATVSAAIGTSRVHWLLPFAEAAYTNPLTVTATGAPPDFAGTYTRGWQNDVVKIYRKSAGGQVNCVVTWRGTSVIMEWIADATSIVPTRPFYLPSSSTVRVGSFWNTRLSNQRADVNFSTKALGCTGVSITGHSLGGAMANLHAHYYVHGFADSGIPLSRLRQVAVFNPARVGNGAFKTEYRNGVINSGRTSWVYCRNGDPVRPLPPNLQHTGTGLNGCDVNGTNRDFVRFWRNHELAFWDQCASSTSC